MSASYRPRSASSVVVTYPGVALVMGALLGGALIAPAARAGLTDNTCVQGLTEPQYLVPCEPSVNTIITFAPPFVEDNERRPTCAVSPSGGQYFLHNSVWVRFIATAFGAKVDICQDGSAVIDAAIVAVYGPNIPDVPLSCTNIKEVGCEIFNCGPDEGSSEVLVGGLVVGNPYMVQAACFRLTGDSCLSPPFNCRVAGNYLLRVACDSTLVPCELTIDPALPHEWELEPCDLARRVNDGCEVSPPAFAAIACGESRRGMSATEGGAPDSDWYRLMLPEPATLTVTVAAEFDPDVKIFSPGASDRCGDRVLVAAGIPGTHVPCDPANPLVVSAAVPAGEYWIRIAPDPCGGPVACTRDYVLHVDATPCIPATGACCTETSCAEVPRAACAGPGHILFGDGVPCSHGLCWTCPPDALPEGEPIDCAAPDGSDDSLNGGCPWYETLGPCSPLENSDVNGDGVVNFDDIDPFVARIGTVCP